jgi:predicted ATPase with chaperone activity
VKRISGPLLDRIDIHVEVPRVNYEKLSGTRQGEPSRAIRERVAATRVVQSRRFKGTRLRTNADMGPAEVREFCRLDEAGQRLMQAAMRRRGGSRTAPTARLPSGAQAGAHHCRPGEGGRHRAGASGRGDTI